METGKDCSMNEKIIFTPNGNFNKIGTLVSSRLRETTFNRVCTILNRGQRQRVEIEGKDRERERESGEKKGK